MTIFGNDTYAISEEEYSFILPICDLDNLFTGAQR